MVVCKKSLLAIVSAASASGIQNVKKSKILRDHWRKNLRSRDEEIHFIRTVSERSKAISYLIHPEPSDG